MADFIEELGTAIQTAMRADTDLRTIIGTYDGSTYAADFADQAQTPRGAAGNVEVMLVSQEGVEGYNTSARAVYRFQAVLHCVDVRGVDGARTVAAKAFRNIFKDDGSAILDTHLVDSASNRLGKSGTARLEEWDVQETEDPDRPDVVANIAIELTHASPLV